MTSRSLVALLLLLAVSPARAREPGVSFDYYVLSLSWSPQYCAHATGPRDHAQCDSGRQYGFVLHGLWPQYEQGYPQGCAGTRKLPTALVDGMLDIMPSAKLVRREWEEHGTCSGLEPSAYFAKVRAAYEAVVVPASYRAPRRTQRLTPRQVEQDFVGANPRLSPDGIAVVCRNRFLQEVRLCLDRNLSPRPCGSDVRDRCRGNQVIVPPVR